MVFENGLVIGLLIGVVIGYFTSHFWGWLFLRRSHRDLDRRVADQTSKVFSAANGGTVKKWRTYVIDGESVNINSGQLE
jgi:hypothetical protein